MTTTFQKIWIAITIIILTALTVRAARFILSHIRREPSAKVFEAHADWLAGYAVLATVLASLGFSVGAFPWVLVSAVLLVAAIGLAFAAFAKRTARKRARKDNNDNSGK